MKDEPSKPTDKPASSGDSDYQFPSLHEGEADAQAAVQSQASVPPPAAPSDRPETSPAAGAVPPARGFPSANKSWYVKNKSAAMFLAFVVVAGAMWGINKMRSQSPDKDQDQTPTTVDEIPVNVVEARLGRFQDTINAVGTLKGEAEIELRFEMDGKIEEFNVSEGAKVRKGQILARLNDRDANLKVQRARIELEQTEKLYRLEGVSKTKLEEARLNLDVARTELEKTQLRATREGIIGDKGADIGEFVTPQRKIATLVAIKSVVVKVGIIEKQVDKVYPGQKILTTVDAYPGNIFEGAIESISPIITGESKTFEITAKIPNPENLLLPGMFARTRIITYEADDAISVPNDALIKTSGGFQVFTVNKENLVESKDVGVGYVSTEFTQIQTGLSPGEIVVVQRPPELKPGSKVKIIEVQK